MAPQSETCPISSDIITDIKQRFKRIVILYDNDEAGIKSAKTLSEQYNLESIFLIEAKDLSDHVLLHGKEYTHNTLKELLNEKQ
jgi:DNA primase